MKNKKIKVLCLIMLTGIILTGCDGISKETDEAADLAADVENAEEPEEISAVLEYEMKYAAGEFTAEDYKTLAKLYAEENRVKEQRDMLEQCYRLHGDAESLQLLQEITVNVSEESSIVQSETQRMIDNISTPEYQNEAVGMLIGSDWMQTMMPKLKEGSRKYYLADSEGNVSLCIEVGYDENGTAYSNVWYMTDGTLRYITKKTDCVQMVTTGMTDGKYQGAFESWICMAGGSEVYHEAGTFENGVWVGDYTAQVGYKEEDTDLFSLWNSRTTMELSEYTGNFGENGITTVTQPDLDKINVVNGGDENENLVVYAYSADNSKYLFLNMEEGIGVSDFVFNSGLMGMGDYPTVTPYEPKPVASQAEVTEQMIDSSSVQIRIFDSNIEWFDGKVWHVVGTVNECMADDPFQAYAQQALAADEEGQESEGQEGEEQEDNKAQVYKRKGAAEVKKEPKKTANTPKKPATETPAPAPKPNPPPANNPPPNPAPSTPANNTPVQPDPPRIDNGNGGDTDIEWGPDIL